MEFNHSKEVNLTYEQALEQLKKFLGEEGFGVISEIDLKDTFKKKINEDIKNYRIVGACNPRIAFQGLQMEEKLGVFLPCNFIVFENSKGVVEVSCINPNATMRNVGKEKLVELAETVNQKLINVMNKF